MWIGISETMDGIEDGHQKGYMRGIGGVPPKCVLLSNLGML